MGGWGGGKKGENYIVKWPHYQSRIKRVVCSSREQRRQRNFLSVGRCYCWSPLQSRWMKYPLPQFGIDSWYRSTALDCWESSQIICFEQDKNNIEWFTLKWQQWPSEEAVSLLLLLNIFASALCFSSINHDTLAFKERKVGCHKDLQWSGDFCSWIWMLQLIRVVDNDTVLHSIWLLGYFVMRFGQHWKNRPTVFSGCFFLFCSQNRDWWCSLWRTKCEQCFCFVCAWQAWKHCMCSLVRPWRQQVCYSTMGLFSWFAQIYYCILTMLFWNTSYFFLFH